MSAASALLSEAMKAMRADPARAAALCRSALQVEPHNLDAGLLLSEALRLTGDYAAARAIITPIATANANHFGAQRQFGVILAANDAPVPASLALRAAADLNPSHPTIWRDLGDQLARAGDVAGGEAAYTRHGFSPSLDPALAKAAGHLRDNDLVAAEAALQSPLRQHPSDIVALRMLGEAQARAGKSAEAEATMRRVLSIAPGFQQTRHDLTQLLIGLGRVEDALKEARELLRREPTNPGARRALAAVLNSAGEYAEALAIYEQLLKEDPNRAPTWATAGHIHKTLGNSEASIDAFRRSIALAPHQGDAYWGLANMKTVRLSDDEVGRLRAQLERQDLGVEDRVSMLYTLGKALEQRKEFDASFGAYAGGAALRVQAHPYDANATSAFVDECIARFDARFFADRAGVGDQTSGPIFVLGLPRSGSTLVEQILASHSTVEGTMELPDINNVVRNLGGDYLAALNNRDTFADLGAVYLQTTARRRTPGVPFFIDKMPNNWMHMALIHLALPNAKIIDTRRHPIACGWSCFKQHFPQGQDFSYNQTDLGRYYADYVRLMAHFDAVLPGRVHRVIHEELVTDPETHIRALLAHCGLPFEDQCLRPHETKRAVNTASAEQVRQPISAKGLDDWRAFEIHLDPLKAALGPVLSAYPDAPK